MWTFSQRGSFSGPGLGPVKAYSGHAEGRNNPDLQSTHRVGPIPRGKWIIAAMVDRHPESGPYVLTLVPAHETETFGRSGFLIHGDSLEHPGEASLGCIILPRQIRELIWKSGDHHLEVVEGAAP